MEVTCSSERLVDFQRTTWRYMPEHRTLNHHRCENLKSYIQNIRFIHQILLCCICCEVHVFWYDSKMVMSYHSNWIYCSYFGLTHSWPWALLEKLPIVQLLKNFPQFYANRKFITVFTRARPWSLSWTRSIQSIQPHSISPRSILILSTHLHLRLPSGFPTDILYLTLHENTVIAIYILEI
jgi:hypothetical protein